MPSKLPKAFLSKPYRSIKDVRVYVRTASLDYDTPSGRELLLRAGGAIYDLWAFMPAFPTFYCSPQPLADCVFLGSVTARALQSSDDGFGDDDAAREQFWDTLRDDVDEANKGTPNREMFDMRTALAHSVDITWTRSKARSGRRTRCHRFEYEYEFKSAKLISEMKCDDFEYILKKVFDQVHEWAHEHLEETVDTYLKQRKGS